MESFPKDVSVWTNETVGSWLELNGFGLYKSKFTGTY